MQVIRPDANNLAGVILTSPKLMIFEDMWRHKKDICVEITLGCYVDFLAGNINLIRYFSLKNMELIDMYRLNPNNRTVISKVYPLFVRDITLAYVAEILDAAKKNNEVSKIIYVPPTHDYKKLKAETLQNVNELKQRGRKYFLGEEGKGTIPHVSELEGQYLKLLHKCMITLGYTFFTEENPNKFTWILY